MGIRGGSTPSPTDRTPIGRPVLRDTEVTVIEPSSDTSSVYSLLLRAVCGAVVGYAAAPHRDDRALYAGLGAAATAIEPVVGLGLFAWVSYNKRSGGY